MKNKILLIFLLQFTLLIAQSGKDNFFPPTPEANSLIKYVDIPVNYSTGVTNYSIPIHTIKLKNLTIPITLTYQSSGLKPSELASNTGFGWELNAGGRITQNVVGKNDLDSRGPLNPYWNLSNVRDFKLPSPVMDLAWSLNPYTRRQLDSIQGAGTDYTMFHDINSYDIDTKPDLFYYSTPNKTGKFFFGENFETKQIPFGKEKIIYNPTSRNFEIIDTDGVKYIYNIYSENLNSTENACIAVPQLNGISNSNSYTYYLIQIITPNNETVDFIYDTVKYNLTNDKDYTRYYNGLYGPAEKITTYYSENTSKVLTKIQINQDYQVEFSYTNYRKDIKGKTQGAAPKTLDDIKIKYKNEIETYHFEYGYFGIAEGTYNSGLFEGTQTNENSEYRLKLKSFQKKGENPYIFSYYNEAAVARYAGCLDHWGYYSETCGRYTMNMLFNDLGSKKEPNFLSTQTNILKNIILPTKGEVEFNYELNTCENYDIPYTTYNWEGSAVYANDDDQFTGEWMSKETIVELPENSITIPYVNFSLASRGPATTSNYAIATLYDENGKDMNVRFIDNLTGNNLKPLDGVAFVKGKKYRLVIDFFDTEENQGKYVGIYFLIATTSVVENSAVGGLRIQSIKTRDTTNEITKRTFDYTDSGKSSGLLYEIPRYFDEYSFFVEMTNGDQNVYKTGWQNFAVQHSRIPSDLFGFNGYHIFYKKVTEKQIDTKDPLNNIKVEKYFTFYDDTRYGDQSYFSKVSYNWKRGLPSQINEFDKNNIIRKTIFSYKFLDTPPSDLNTSRYEPGFPLFNPSFPNEFHKRSLDITVLRYSPSFYNLYAYSNFKIISAWYYMDKKITEEDFNGNILKTEEDYKYDNPISAQLTSQTTKNSNGETIETKYYYPDDLLNEPFMTELKTTNRISIPVITEQYKAGALLSKNKVVFAKDLSTSNLLVPKEIYAAKFPNALPTLANIGNLEKKITYNQYDDKGNVLQYTTEGGIPVSIIWGYNKTYPIAKIENATYDQITSHVGNLQILSNADDDNCMSSGCNEQILRNKLEELRIAFPQYMISTYTYNPLIGVTSIIDPKGVSSYYEYDSVNRLKFVKDKYLNVLQKYCYNYKGQQINCADNTSTSVFIYKSAARSGSFTKNNCAAGGTGSAVSYSQPEGAYTSTISQADADSNGLAKFNTDGLTNANSIGSCIFYSGSLSGSFTKKNCASGGTGSNVPYSQAYGAEYSYSSQADADSKGLNKFNTDGLNNANAYGSCTFYSAALSGSFIKNNCAPGGTGSSVNYSQAYGIEYSNSSQADADSKGLAKFNADGLINANTYGNCIFYSAPLSGSFSKKNCAPGGIGLSVSFSQAYGVAHSYSSQAEADNNGLYKFNVDGQANADANGSCIFYSSPLNGSFTKSNCDEGGTGSIISYSQAYGAEYSYSSQADADSKGLNKFNTEGQANANTNGYCTFYSWALSGPFVNDNCPERAVPSTLVYTQQAGAVTSRVSQSDANANGLTKFIADGKVYVNANGECIFHSVNLGAYFPKTNCPAGTFSSPSLIYYEQSVGAVTSKISQADADARAAAKFNLDGPAYANSVGECEYYSSPLTGTFVKNNCPVGTTGSSVVYSLGYGATRSTVSQAIADAAALNLFNFYGQAQANGGTCTFYSMEINYPYVKNNCPGVMSGSTVYYNVPYGKYQSNKSQDDADYKAIREHDVNGQNYANTNGYCLNPGEEEN